MAEVARRPALVFIGFMGAGKTTAAAAAAQALGETHVDADELFASRFGELPADRIEREGEASFRAAEEQLVLELLNGATSVIALGGGAVETPAVREALAGHVVIWCRVGIEEARRRVEGDPAAWRPLAADPQAFRERFERREPIYAELARAVLAEADEEVAARAAPWLNALRSRPELRLTWGHSPSAQYPAVVGEGALELLDSEAGAALDARRWFAIADREALGHHADLLPATEAVIEVESGEAHKTLGEAERVLRELARAGARRDDALLAFGGGVVGDLAGLCAAVYQRGVGVVQAPTTLVGQVDSAYGGKTGVDLPEAKNYVGAYHMPAAVLADTRTLATLPEAELAAGFAEVLKTALIAGGELWERVRGIDSLDPAQLTDVIFACVRTKLEIVAADERDAGRRAVLNLGHTVGHAIEAATDYSRYRHGEAVGLGLLAALRLSGADELREEVGALLERNGLPTQLQGVATDAVLGAVERDKKQTPTGLGWVLLARPGEPREEQRVDLDSVRGAVEELRGGSS
jgi:3-dehydroquinate synthetase/shikimate kinase